jgi:hypothetical protein
VKKINLSDIKQSKGSMYQVKLKTINDDLIDYDKTLKDQPAILKRLNNLIEVKTLKSKYNKDIDNLTGKQFYEFLESNKATPRKDVEVSKQLNEVGIKGIQYLDNSSRGERFSIKLSTNKGAYDHEPIQSGDRNQIEELAEDYRKKGFKVKIEEGGDKNYVIFDDKIIDIMKKYGIVGAVGVTAMQGGEQSPEANLSL